MRQRITKYRGVGLAMLVMTLSIVGMAYAQDPGKGATSYPPVDIKEDFASTMARLKTEKPDIEKKHVDLFNERYDPSNRPAKGVTMSRGKAVQEGVRVKLLKGATWEKLAATSPEEIREKNLFPAGFFPLPHPKHSEGGMLFPKFLIDAIKKQEVRDFTRFDVDFDLPDHVLPEFPAPIYLTTRPDLGDIRPQEFRHRLGTPTLRGVNIQRLFGSQRALKSIEDFTEFEQRAAYFDGDPVIATKKRVNILERASQVHFMAEFQSILDFPPAPKHDGFGGWPDQDLPLRGIKDSPPYLHDDRLLTLEDTVEYFKLLLQLKLDEQEKKDLVPSCGPYKQPSAKPRGCENRTLF